MKKNISFSLIVSLFYFSSLSAQVAINQDNSDPDASAILDVKSTDKGLLIPRMTTMQRTAINNPATGLMVFDNNTNSFWFYSGTIWIELTSGAIAAFQDADNDTKIQVEESADEDNIRIDLAGSERMVIQQNPTGGTLIQLPNNDFNTFLGQDAGQANTVGNDAQGLEGRYNNFIGYQAGYTNTIGFNNTFNGYQTGYSNTIGHNNLFNGNQAGFFNTEGHSNLFNGNQAGYSNTLGHHNVFNGMESGFSNTTGHSNLFNGNQAGYSNTTGYGNVFNGYLSGRNNTSGYGNVFTGQRAGFSNIDGHFNIFIGYDSGYNETGSNKLYIENSNSSTPLIYGEFDNDIVKIHGTLGIKDEYAFPITKGLAGQVLQTDGLGNTTWATPAVGADDQKADVFQLNGTNLELSLENDGEATKSVDLSSINTTKTLIADANNDTKIQVEESANEDKIRIDLAGNERVVIEQNASGGTLINIPNNNENLFIGEGAGLANTPGLFGGFDNSFVGNQAGLSNSNGNSNSFFGSRAGTNTTSGHNNSFFGTSAGLGNTAGIENAFFGRGAGIGNTTGKFNVLLGNNTGTQLTDGHGNIFIGHEAGSQTTDGNHNIYIGYQAGFNATGSNQLFIENSNSNNPLIYGDFANDYVEINGRLSIKERYTFPITDGTAGQVMQTNGLGNLSWVTPSPNTDNQKADLFALNGNNLELSLENDGEDPKSVDLSSLNATKTLIADADNNTKIQVEEGPNEDSIRIDIAGIERMVIRQSPTGATLLNLPNNNKNTFVGQDAGQATTPNNPFEGAENSFIGHQAGYANTSGSLNNFNGFRAGFSNTTGALNTFMGSVSGYSNKAGEWNTYLGFAAGYLNETGFHNTFLGGGAGHDNTMGNRNVFVGAEAGFGNNFGSGNIFLGYQAGYNEAGTDRLYIESSNSATPLIYGEFDNDIVKIHGTLGIKDEYTFPITKGLAGQVLQTDGLGNTTWATPAAGADDQKADVFQLNGNTLELSLENDGEATKSVDLSSINATKTLIADADDNTKIQVEESTNEDNIRIDIGGIESMVIGRNPNGLTLIHLPNNNSNTFLGQDAGRVTAPVNGDDAGNFNNFIGYQAGFNNTAGFSNTFNGYQAGYSNTTGMDNAFLGYQAGYLNTTGNGNTFNGVKAGFFNEAGQHNAFYGILAGHANTLGNNNTFQGSRAGFSNTTGNENTILGANAGYNNQFGSENVFLGFQAGLNTLGSHNIFLGYLAGSTETGSNKLYIENSNSATPLIYGEFDNDLVKIHGTLGIKDEYTFPITKGMAGQVLQTDGAGNTTWTTPAAGADDQKADVFQLNGNNLELSLENDGEATKSVDLSSINTDNQKADVFQLNGNNLELSLENDGEATKSVDLSSINTTKTKIADTDDNTKIQVEESANEDNIRIDIAGTERMVIKQGTAGATLINLPNNNFNTFLGQDAGQATLPTDASGTESVKNSFMGYEAGYANTTGYNNTFNGYQAGHANTTGYFNVFNGLKAGAANTTGFENNFNGYKAGLSNTTGSHNTFVGSYAGRQNLEGNSNIFLGYRAGYFEIGSNKLYIENSDSSTPLIYGEFDNDRVTINGQLTSTNILYPNAGIHLPGAYDPNSANIGTAGNFISFGHVGNSEDFLGYAFNTFYFKDSNGGADVADPDVYAASFLNYSSRRWKHNIKKMDNALSIIQQLQGVTYTWNKDRGHHDDFGFIAEEVHQVLPQIARKGADGQVDGVAYGKLTPYLVEAIKEQQIIIDKQNEKMENQNEKIENLERQVAKINELERMVKQLQAQQ